MNWISAKDSLPPFNHEVLYVAITDTGTREMMTGHLGAQGWTHCCMFYSTMHLNENVIVTHWMELPEFPDPHPLANVIDDPLCPEYDEVQDRLNQQAIASGVNPVVFIPPIAEAAVRGTDRATEFAKKFCEDHKDLLKRLADR